MSESITDRIQDLLKQREEHAAALAEIDEKLKVINNVLGLNVLAHRPGRKPAAGPSGKPAAAAQRRGRGKFSTTGEQSILDFIKKQKNPTTKEINAHWKQEGRGSTADSLLGQMVKQGKLKRKPLGGKLGSQYVIP